MSAAPAQADPERLLTLAEIAHELGCHPSGPTRWIVKGVALKSGERLRLEAVRLPGSWRVRRESLDAFLQSLTADRARPDIEAPAQPRSQAHSARVERMRAGLAAEGFRV
jgi:Helix-turn-helix domain